jgi:hypothetical protein
MCDPSTDRLYNKKRWNPIRRTPIWIAFGDLILPDSETDKTAARTLIEQQFAASVRRLSDQLRESFSLTDDDLPHPPRARMGE